MTLKQEHARFLGALFVTTVASRTSSMIDAAIGGFFLGENVVSSVNLVLPIQEIFNSLTLLLGMGACTAAAKAFGQGKAEEVRRHFTSAIVSALTVFVALVGMVYLMRDTALDILCGESFLREETGRYLVSILPWFIVGNADSILCEFVAMTGRPLLATYGALAYFFTKLLTDWLFVGVFGFGIEGFGYASLVASLVAAVILLSYCLGRQSPLRFIRCSFSQMAGFTRANVHYGKGLLSVEVSAIVFTFAMNSLVLRYMGEKGFFCWSVVMMIFLVGDYAAAASQETILSLGGKYLGAGQKECVRVIIRRSMLFAASWIMLCLTLVFVLPDYALPLLGATEHAYYPLLLKVIAMTVAVPGGLNLTNLYLVRLVMRDKIKLFILLIVALYLSVPIFLLMAHCLAPGHEWWGMVALIPLQVGLVLLRR